MFEPITLVPLQAVETYLQFGKGTVPEKYPRLWIWFLNLLPENGKQADKLHLIKFDFADIGIIYPSHRTKRV